MDLSNIPALNGDHKKQKSRWNKNIVYFLREGQKMQKRYSKAFKWLWKFIKMSTILLARHSQVLLFLLCFI